MGTAKRAPFHRGASGETIGYEAIHHSNVENLGSMSEGNEMEAEGRMEKRLDGVEHAVIEVKERLVRVETRLDSMQQHMATKADLADLRTEFKTDIWEQRTFIAEALNTQIKWTIGTMVALTIAVFSIAKLFASSALMS